MLLQQSRTLVQVAPAGAQQLVPSQSRPEQQSLALAHERFTALQQRPFVPQVVPEQHGVAALQAIPSGAQQRPSQLPPQHCTASLHAVPSIRQGPQLPFVQIDVPQHCACEEQLAPCCPQHLPSSQKPLQQSSGVAHELPTLTQSSATQTPPSQAKPAQHSSSPPQAAPDSLQSHDPARQLSLAQQSLSLVQALPRSVQLHTPCSQCSPSQQSPSAVHVTWLPPQRAQMLPRHSRPVQHFGPLGSSLQVAFSSAHTARHVPRHSKPEQQSLLPAHTAPSRPHPARQIPPRTPESSRAQLRFTQQSAFDSQVSPFSLQRGMAHEPFSQPCEQQSPGVSQAAPSVRQPWTQRSP